MFNIVLEQALNRLRDERTIEVFPEKDMKLYLWADDMAILLPTRIIPEVAQRIKSKFVEYGLIMNIKEDGTKTAILPLKIFKRLKDDKITKDEPILSAHNNRFTIFTADREEMDSNWAIARNSSKKSGIPLTTKYKYLGYPLTEDMDIKSIYDHTKIKLGWARIIRNSTRLKIDDKEILTKCYYRGITT